MVDSSNLMTYKQVAKVLRPGYRTFGEILNDFQAEFKKPLSREGLAKLLKKHIGKGNIQKKLVKDKSYPVYELVKESELYAEMDSMVFRDILKESYVKNAVPIWKDMLEIKIPKEWELLYTKGMIEFFGFYVMCGLMTSVIMPKKIAKDLRLENHKHLREIWLKDMLSLEEGVFPISEFFKHFIEELTGKTKPTNKDMTVAWQKIALGMDKLYPNSMSYYKKAFNDNYELTNQVMSKTKSKQTAIRQIRMINYMKT